MSLLIINNHDSFTFNLVDLIRRLDVPFQVVNVEELDLDAVDDFSHLLISPGPDVPRAYPQLFELLARYQHSKSILGVCLGHQMLCEFLAQNYIIFRHHVMGKPSGCSVWQNPFSLKICLRPFKLAYIILGR